MKIDYEKEETASRLRGSLLEFCRFFYEHITGRQFIISNPIGRESHHITVCRALTEVQRLKSTRLMINLPPGCGKSTLVSMFIAWCWAQRADCNFLYISYAHEIAVEHTTFVRSIVCSPMYKYLFDISIHPDRRAKDNFSTTSKGALKAFGSSGPVTGQNAGLPAEDTFSGAVIIDDAHKADEVHSDTIRQRVLDNYERTIRTRPRSENVPIIYIGHRLHQDDLPNFFLSGKDIQAWDTLILKDLDAAGNALYPEIRSKEHLLQLQEKSPYVFCSQHQQEPVPAGGSLFNPDWFVLLDKEPEIISTFITADTAETEKSWNDASVFSFWGVYEIENFGKKTGLLGLHWLNCVELRIEPKDLQSAFTDFYADCTLHPNPPLMAAIEKKSTGVTLVSVMKEIRGLNIREIERTAASKSKGDRFVALQQYVAGKRISLPARGRHTEMCLNHMSKITPNSTHAFDDIADTLSDAVHIALIEKTIYNVGKSENHRKNLVQNMNRHINQKIKAGALKYGRIG